MAAASPSAGGGMDGDVRDAQGCVLDSASFKFRREGAPDALFATDRILGQGKFTKVWKAVPLVGSAGERPGFPGFSGENSAGATKTATGKPLPAGPKVAMKVYSKGRLKERGALRTCKDEVLSMACLTAPLRPLPGLADGLGHVAQLIDTFESHRGVHIVMELGMGGSLFAFLRKVHHLPLAMARVVFRQVALGVYYAHACGIAHRNVKAENILLANAEREGQALDTKYRHDQLLHDVSPPVGPDGEELSLPPDLAGRCVKLGDFGTATRVDIPSGNPLTTPAGELTLRHRRFKQRVGSPEYMAPEVIEPPYGDYGGYPVDVWSMGVLLWVMLTGKYPFKGASAQALMQQVLKHTPEWDRHTSPACIGRAVEWAHVRTPGGRPDLPVGIPESLQPRPKASAAPTVAHIGGKGRRGVDVEITYDSDSESDEEGGADTLSSIVKGARSAAESGLGGQLSFDREPDGEGEADEPAACAGAGPGAQEAAALQARRKAASKQRPVTFNTVPLEPWPTALVHLMMGMLNRDAEARLTAQQVFLHPWVQGRDFLPTDKPPARDATVTSDELDFEHTKARTDHRGTASAAKPVAAASAQASSASHSGDALRAAMAAARAEESAAAGTVKAADLLKSLGVDEEASSTSSGRSKGTGGLTAKLGKPLKGSASTPAVQDTSTPGAVKASDLIAQLKADKGRKGGSRPPAAAAGGGGGGSMRRVASHTAGSSSKGSEEGGPVKAADLLKSLGADKRGGKGRGGRKDKGLTAKLGKPLEGSSSMTASVDSGESGSSAVKADALISKLKGDKGRKGGKGSPRSGKPPAAAGGGGSGGMRRVASHTAGSSSKGGESSGPVKAADLLKSLGAGKPRPKRRSEGRPPVPRPSGASASTAAAAASGGGSGTARDPEAEARAGILERLKASARAGGGEGTIKADVLLRRLGSKAVMSSSMHAGSSKSRGVGGDSASVGAGKADLEVEGALSVEDADDGSESSSTAHMGRPGAAHEDDTQSAVSAEDRSAIIGRLLASDRTATRAASGAVRADTLLRKLGSMRLDDGGSVGGDSTGGSVPRVISDVGSAALALAASKEGASKETLRAVALERIRQAREAGDREGAVKAEELLERLKRTGSMRSTGSSRSGVEPTLYNTGDAGAVGGGDGRSYIQKAMAAGRAADAEQGGGTVKAADLLARLRKEGRGRGKRRGVPEMQILRNEEDVEAAVGAEAYASLMQRLKDASKEGSTGTVPAAELLAALQGGRGGKAMPRGGSMRTPGKSRAQQAAVGSSSGLTPGEARSAILQQLKQSPRRPSSGAVPAEELIAALMPKSGKARSARAPHARSASDGSASVDKGSSSDKSSGRGSKATGGVGGAVARQHGGAVPASELIASLSRDKKVKRTMSMRAAQKGKEKWEILQGDAGAPAAAAAGATPEEMRAALIERLKHTAAEGNREGTVKAEELISRLKRTGSMRSTGSGGGVSGHSRKPSLDVEGAIAALGLTDAQEATLRLELAKAAEGKGRGMKRITSGVFFSTLAASRMKLGLKRVGSGKAGSPRAALGRALPPRPKGSEAGRDAPAPVLADQLIAKLGSRRLDRGGSKLAMEDLEAFVEEASSARDGTLDTLDDHVDALVDDGDLDGEDEESEGRSAGVPGAEQDKDSAPSAQAAPQEQATEPAGDAHPAMARLPSMVIRSKRKARSVRDLLAKARAEEASKEDKSGSVAGDSLSASEGSGEAAGDGGSEAGQSAAASVPPQPLDLHRVDDTELALSEAGSDASRDSLPLAAPFHVMSPVAEGGETESPSRPGSRGGGQLEAFPVSGRRSRLSSSPLRPPRQSGEQTSDESGGQPVKLSGSSSDADGAIGAEHPAAGASEQGADSPLATSPEQAETDAVSSGEGQASTAHNADKQGGAEEEGEASTTPRPSSSDGRDSGAASARSGRAGEVKPMHKGVDLLAMAPQLKLRRNVQDEPSRRYSDVFGPPRLSTHRPSPSAAAGAAAGDEDGHGGHTGGRGESSGEGAPPRPRHNFGIVTHQEMEQLRAASDVSSSEETPSVVEAIARQRAHARTMSDAEWQAKRTEQFRNKRMSRAALLSVKSFAAGAGRVGSFSRHGSMPGMALGGLGGFSAADVLAAAAAQEAARVRGDEEAEGSSPGPTVGEEASATGSGEAAGVVVEHSVERMRVRRRKHARATRNVSRMATKVSAAMRLFSPKRTPDTAGSPEAFAVGGAFQGIAMRRPGGAAATLDASPPQESKASDTRSSTLTSADGVGVHSFAHSRDLQGGQSTQGSKSDERGGSTASTDLLPLAGVTRVESAAGLSGVETASLASGTDVGRWPSSTVRPQSSDASDDRPATPPTQQPERLSQQLHGHLPPPVQTTVERQVRGRQSPTNLMSTASRDTSEGVESPVKVVRGAGEEGLELGDLPLDTPMAPAGPLGDSSSTGSLPMPDDQASGRHSASAAHLPEANLKGAAAAPAQGAFASDEPTVAQRVAATHSLAVPGVRSPAPTRQAVLRGSSRSPASPTASEGSASAPEGILGFSARIGGAEAVSSQSPTHTSPRRELLVRPDSPDSLDEVQRPGPGPWAGSSAEELQLQTQHRVPHAPGETLQSLIIAPSPGPASRTRRTATELVSPASRKPRPPLTSPDTPGTGLRQSTGSETPGLRPVPQTGASPRTHKVDAGGELHGVPSDSSLVPGPLGSDPSRWHGVPAGGGSPLPPKAYDFQTVLEPAFAEGFSLTAQGPPPATNATLSQRRHVVPPASPARVGSALGGGGREAFATHGPRKGAGLPPPSPASPRPTPLINPSRSSQTIQPQGGPHLDLALVATVPYAGASPRQESKAAPNSSLRDVVRQTRTPGARGPSVAFSMMSHGTLQTMMAADTTASPRGSADTRSYHDSPAVVFSADGSSAVVSVRRDAISGSQLLGPSAATQPAGAWVRGDAAEVHGGLDPLVALPRSALAQASPTASTEHLHIRAGKAGPHHAPAPTTPPGQATRAAPAVSARGRLEGSHSARSLRQAAAHMPFPVPATSRKAPREEAARAPPLRSHKQAFSAQGRGSAAVAQLGQSHSRSEFADAALLQLDLAASISPRGPAARSRAVGSNTLALAAKRSMASGASGSGRRSRRRKRQR